MIRLMLWCLLGIGVWFSPTSVSAQGTPGLLDSAEEKSETVIRRAPLDVIVLYDLDGNRILKLPGWPLTEVDAMDAIYRILMKDQQDQVPPFVLRDVSATGTVVGNYVEAQIQINVITSGSGSVKIPLGFKEGLLPGDNQTGVPPFRYTGPGVATLDSQEQQYVAFITPRTPQAAELEGSEDSDKPERPAGTEHTLSLLLWFPLAPNGGNEKRLSLSFPQSNSSKFLLEVPMTHVDASATQGFLLDQQEDTARQSTLLRIQGLRTDTEISWKKREIEIVDEHPALLVERAAIDVRLEPRSSMYDAVLPVSSASGSFDQFQIRLPQGSVLDREMTDQYAVSGNYSIEEGSDGSIVAIRLQQKTTGPVSIHLRAVQQFEEDTSNFRRELAGFEVLEAERQSGFLTVSVFPSEMKPHCEPIRGIRSPEGRTTTGTTGDTRFEFLSQPFLLSVRATAPQIRISVKPDYQFRMSRGDITMDARLAYTVSGSRASAVYLRLPDSQWDWEFGTSSIVDTDKVICDETGLLMIPLRSPRDGTFNIDFRAYRTIDVAGEQKYRLVLPIPRPEQARSEPALVIMVPAPNVEILPNDQDTRGLIPQSRRVRPPIRFEHPNTRQESLFYHTELSDAQFVADLVFHQQKTDATIQTEVRLFEENDRVIQIISYDAAFAVIERVHLLLPKTLDINGNVQVQCGNQKLELRDSISNPQESVSDNWVRKTVQLPEPLFQFQLEFQYSPPPLAVADDNDTVPFSLSLIVPEGVPVTDHRIHFFTPSGYKVGLQPESRQFWEPFRELRRLPAGTAETFRSVQSPRKIALFVSVAERNISGTTIVEQAWLQTCLTSTLRQDQATYLIRSTNDFVSLQLPPDSTRDHSVAVQVDHMPILQPNISPTGLLTIPILPEQYNRLIEVTVGYRYKFEVSDMKVQMILPSFTKETLVPYKFWQVVLPQSWHIIGTPAGWTLKYDWSWNGWFWWRVPSIRKSDIGFTADSPTTNAVIAESSQYVFSHLQPPSHVTFYIVKRSQIILCSSGAALFIGLVLIYVPQSRYAGSLFGLGVCLLAILFYQPPLVLLMLQAATFGVFLALGTGYVYRIFHRQSQWIPPAFPMMDEMSQHYPTPLPLPPLQTVHEVVIDGDSGSEEPSAINNHNGVPPNGQ